MSFRAPLLFLALLSALAPLRALADDPREEVYLVGTAISPAGVSEPERDSFLQRIRDLLSSREGREDFSSNGRASLSRLSAGLIIGDRAIRPDELHHNIQMLEGGADERWREVKIGAEALVPAQFSLPFSTGAVGFSVGSEVLIRRALTIKAPSAIQLDATEEQSDRVLRQLGRDIREYVRNSARVIAVPHDGLRFVDRFVNGVEVTREGAMGLIFRADVRLGLPILNGRQEVYTLLTGEFKRKVTLLDKEKKLVRLRYETAEIIGAGESTSLGLDFTLFNIGSVDAELRVNLLYSARLRTRRHAVVFDYTYDLRNPAALEAFNKAISGDLDSSQELAFTAEDLSSEYQGIVLNDERTSDLWRHLRDRRIGFNMDQGILRGLIGRRRSREVFGGFLSVGRKLESIDLLESSEDYFGEEREEHSYRFRRQDRRRLLWHWGRKFDGSVALSASLQEIPGVNERGEDVTWLIPELEIEVNKRAQPRGARLAREFLATADSTIGVITPSLRPLIRQIQESGRCESARASTLHWRGRLHGKALLKIADASEEQMWELFARTQGYADSNSFGFAHSRYGAIARLNRAERREARRFERYFVRKLVALRRYQVTDPQWLEGIRDIADNLKADLIVPKMLVLLAFETQPEQRASSPIPLPRIEWSTPNSPDSYTVENGLNQFLPISEREIYLKFESEPCKFEWSGS